ncbi:MAG: A/G-specific adenine glycosylase [Proteiniphilum sp.]|jgi:A/G-specific adenine glycosylase|nr:A/G-specific adenine glycosylase [Proteiniphilum sp.]
MNKKAAYPHITTRLLNWYKEHKRDLPWRETTDVYSIWISEVILQQTRISQGWDYFLRFMDRFPTVASLAGATEEEVLKLWQGLGYYSRARNMHAAAKQIMNHFGGIFPTTYSEILSLKGVGEYTASAIASIAFNEPRAVVDGNVNRVIARLFAIELSIHTPEGKKLIAEIAQSLLSHESPGNYNQALMDFGAMVCTPAQPRCTECLLQDYCAAYAENRVTDFPVNNRKITIKKRYFHYFHIVQGNSTFLQKRVASDIWRNMYEFPLIETVSTMEFSQLEQTKEFRELFAGVPSLSIDHQLTLKHQLTHQVVHTHFYRITIPDEYPFTPPLNSIRIEKNHLTDYPVSRLTDKYIALI